MSGMVAPAGGGRVPTVVLNGANTAPPAGRGAPPVRPPARVFGGPNPGGLASPAENSTAARSLRGPGPNPGGLANPQNNPPKGGAPRPPRQPSPGAKVAAAKAAAGGSTPGLPKTSSASAIMASAERAAAAIYNPAIDNYNAQQTAQNGLAEKRTSDLAAFGQWYQGQQNALAAEESQRQSNLQALLGQLGSNEASATPTNGVQSSIGNNLGQVNGGAAATAAQGSNAANAGILSTNALANESNTNSGQNELTALGGSYQQNMMGQISADLTKNTTAIQDAESKVYTAEGSTADKLDSTLQTAQTAGQKNYLTYLDQSTKNAIQSRYDSEQANSKAASEILATAEANGWTPTLRAAYARYMGGAVPSNGPTVQQQKVTSAINIANAKANQAAYDGVTKRLSEQVSGQKVADTYALGQLKQNLAAAAQGEKVNLTNAEIKYYAARTGLSNVQARAALIKAVAYAASKAGTSTTTGVKPLTTNEAATQLSKAASYQNQIANSANGTAGKLMPAFANPNAARTWINSHIGSGGSMTSSLMWAAFDMHYYGALTPRTHQMLLDNGFSQQQLANYKVAAPPKGK